MLSSLLWINCKTLMRKEYQYSAAGAHCSNINHIAYIIVWFFQPAANPNEQAYILTFTLYSELFWKNSRSCGAFAWSALIKWKSSLPSDPTRAAACEALSRVSRWSLECLRSRAGVIPFLSFSLRLEVRLEG